MCNQNCVHLVIRTQLLSEFFKSALCSLLRSVVAFAINPSLSILGKIFLEMGTGHASAIRLLPRPPCAHYLQDQSGRMIGAYQRYQPTSVVLDTP